MSKMDQPWSPANATEILRARARGNLEFRWTGHAKDQMAERDLIVGDVLHVLKHGFVYEEPEPATQKGCYRYKMECTTPNSHGRTVRIVLIPSDGNAVKVVTVMWKDNK